MAAIALDDGFDEFDEDGDGNLSWNELRCAIHDEKLVLSRGNRILFN